MKDINRRDVIKGTTVGGLGVFAFSLTSAPTIAASTSNWTGKKTNEANNNGNLSSLTVPESGFDFVFDWDNLSSGNHQITFTVSAKLSSATSFEEVTSGTFTVSGDSGSVKDENITWDTDPYPANLLGSTSMSASDFQPASVGSNKDTVVDVKVAFTYDGMTDSGTVPITINVGHTDTTSPTDGLVSYYPLNPSSDDFASSNDGTTNSTTEVSDSTRGSVLDFNGTGSHIKLDSDDTLNLGGGGFTIASWIKVESDPGTTASERNTIVSKTTSSGTSSAESGYEVTLAHNGGYGASNANELVFRFGTGSSEVTHPTGFTPNVGTWYHVVLVYDQSSDTVKLYVDDSEVYSATETGLLFGNTYPVYIGKTFGSSGNSTGVFDGRVSSVYLYEKALAPSEVTTLFDATVITSSGGVVIDDFEDGDLSEYATNGSYWSADTNSPVVNGSYSLKYSPPDNSANTIRSTSGLERYPQAGDTFDVWVNLGSSGPFTANNTQLLFGIQSTVGDNEYRVPIRGRDDQQQFAFQVRENGSQKTIASASYAYDPDTWYRVEVIWGEGGSFTITLYDIKGTQLQQITATDSTFASGGFGLLASSTDSNGAAVAHDYAQITATTSGTGVIDDFEDGDLSEYAGDIGGFNVQTGSVYEGTYALESDGPTTSQYIYSTSDLPRYPRAGDTVQFRAEISRADSTIGAVFAATSGESGYLVALDDANERLYLARLDSGSFNMLSENAFTVATGTWYRVKVDWGASGSITATAYNGSGTQVAQVSATDSTYTGGGFGWKVFSSGSQTIGAHGDIAEITQSADTTATGTVDDFEDNDIAEYSGDTSIFSTQNSVVYEGTYALKAEGTGTFNGYILDSSSGLPRYPEAGDTFEFRGRRENISGTSGTLGMLFGINGSDRYQARLQYEQQQISLQAPSGTLGSQSVSLTENEWYRGVVEWGTSGNITFTLYDSSGTEIASVSGTDSTYTSGDFGWGHVESGESNIEVSYYDSAKII
jgi:hypothetical protein